MVKTKIVVVLAMSLLIVAFLTADAAAGSNGIPLNWVFSPDSDTVNTNTSESVYWTNSNVEIGIPTNEADTQVMGIYGVGALLPTNQYSSFIIEIDWFFKTWDSYNAPGTQGSQPNGNPIVGTGYFDSWTATITEGGYYWQESLTDPINTDVDIVHIFVLEGGTSYNDGFEEQYVNPSTPGLDAFGWVVPGAGDYYLNLVLDTKTTPANNGFYPSHGEWSHVTVTPVPAAVILGILGLGVAGIKLRKYA
jgi:hypothetical protein